MLPVCCFAWVTTAQSNNQQQQQQHKYETLLLCYYGNKQCKNKNINTLIHAYNGTHSLSLQFGMLILKAAQLQKQLASPTFSMFILAQHKHRQTQTTTNDITLAQQVKEAKEAFLLCSFWSTPSKARTLINNNNNNHKASIKTIQ